jgi:BirA family transcriptional regulator, biotin operon repressor / biotin---[acetyl-CoA-carboxylase] ligase
VIEANAVRASLADARLLGVPAECHASIGSTNDEAFRRAAEGAPEGLVVVAGQQTAGRGRQGRTWWDAPGASLLFSALLAPTIPTRQFPLLSLAMACSVAETGETETGAPFAVKWPNDVLWGGRKLCGVLAESRQPGASGASGSASASGAARPLLVIGTGVNLNQAADDFPPEFRERATSLRAAAGGRRFEPARVLAGVLGRFERYLALARGGDAGALWAEVTLRLPAPGTAVAVDSGGRRVEGVVAGIAETGALEIREPGRAEITVVSAGEIV